jgi:hypothetical protein
MKSRFLILSFSLVTSSKLPHLRLWCSTTVRTQLLLLPKIKQVNLIQLRVIPANVYLTYPILPQSFPHASLHIIPANTTLLKHEVNVVFITESQFRNLLGLISSRTAFLVSALNKCLSVISITQY